jgi:hypothetical protein
VNLEKLAEKVNLFYGIFFSFNFTHNCILVITLIALQGYRVLVVEQTETPEQLELRRKEMGIKDKVCLDSIIPWCQ